LPSLSTNCTFLFSSLVRKGSTRCRDPAPLISLWRKSQNGRLVVLTLSGWLRWHLGIGFSFVVIACVGFVSVVGGREVVVVTVVFEDRHEIFEAESLLIVFVVVVKVSVSNHVIKMPG
jgi:hypothetical protein